ncbi:MAG: family protein phosphatase [Cryptosporangiaceae bacterium]|nr:family protein phosphatase [Cryptosporangiaceae bacterium]
MPATPVPESGPAASESGSVCPACGEHGTEGAAYCEGCGARLTGPTPEPANAENPQTETAADRGGARSCPSCGAAGAVGGDGYCIECGMLATRERDHIEIDASTPGLPAAAVTDRGLRHHRNEDAVWLVTRPRCGDVVVADGVSSSFDPDVASALAVETAGTILGQDTGPAVVTRAIAAAAAAVAALASEGDPRRRTSNPACTIVAATVRDGVITCGWAGDSRAYWVPDSGEAAQLTTDDSWVTAAIRQGTDPAAAWADRRAHAITAWLGADAGTVDPHVTSLTPAGPGLLVVCSDGLWNYLTGLAEFAAAVREHAGRAAGGPAPMLALTRSLTEYAVASGGQDNITVAVLRLGG